MHFFTEHDKIQTETAAYGPVTGSETTKYNVTHQFSLSGEAKAFACQKGRILVIPSLSNSDLVNVILKPDDSLKIQFPKIHFYVYRGLQKSSFINTETTIKLEKDSDNSDFIKNLWKKASDFKVKSNILEDPSPATFGYYSLFTPLISFFDIEALINSPDITTAPDLSKGLVYNSVEEGEWLGNFGSSCGFEIITGNQNLKLDIDYVREGSHMIDVFLLPTGTPSDLFKIKVEREKILNYIDPAAFWGMHYLANGVKHSSSQNIIKGDDFYNKIIAKYSTKNTIYLEILGQRGRSFNFYGSDGQISFNVQGSPTNLVNYQSHGWPIIIKNIPDSTTKLKPLEFSFNYRIDTNVIEEDASISAYCFFPNVITNKKPVSWHKFITSKGLIQKSVTPPNSIIRNGQTKAIDKIPNASVTLFSKYFPVANYFKIQTINKQSQPILNYFEDLWQANKVYNLLENTTPPAAFNCYWKVSTKKRIVDLIGQNLKDIVVTDRVFFDKGKNSVGTIKNRRLYQAVVTDASENNNNLIIKSLIDGSEKDLKKENYYDKLYDNKKFQIYKGKINDGGTIINSLSFISTDDFEKKQSYFQIGILEEEFNKLYYNSAIVPNPLPAVTYIPQYAQNVFLHLEEVTVPYLKIFRKYKLGLRYEDNVGTIQTKFPTTDVIVYTIDSLFFFTKNYSDYQEFYEEFAKTKVHFRTIMDQNATYDDDRNSSTPETPVYIFNPPTSIAKTHPYYKGEFGFDWLREGDNGEAAYRDIIEGGYERYSDPDTNTAYEHKDEAYKFLINEYQNIPTQSPDKLYHSPYLNIYSERASKAILPSAGLPKPPFEVELRVLVEIDEAIGSLEFEYESAYFEVTPKLLKDKGKTVKRESLDKTIKIKCKADFKDNKYIKIFAKKGTEKKLAGQIIVCKNSLINRKEIKFVLVEVKTDIDNDGITKEGVFGTAEKTNLINASYQTLLNGVIEYGPDLDLSNDADYKIIGGVYGIFIYNDPGTFGHGKLNEDCKSPNFFSVLRSKFLAINPRYKDYFTVFAFDEIPYDKNTLGQVESVRVHNVSLFAPSKTTSNPTGRDTTTLNHESYHGLGLQHTHSDGAFKPERKYIYHPAIVLPPAPPINPTKATDNIMSYNSNAITLWYWQWKIVKSILSK